MINPNALSFADATAVKVVDSHTYEANLEDDWCIGTVPHGGYVTSCFLQAARKHFDTTLSKQNQPHTMTLHLQFPKRTEVGPAKFVVKDVKLGRQTSMIHMSLVQHGKEVVIGYLNHTNIANEKGVSFDTKWELTPSPYTVDLKALKAGNDKNWVEQAEMPFASFRKASSRVRFYFPRQGQKVKNLSDQWLTFRNGEKFTDQSLGYVADMFPQIVESFITDEDPYAVKHKIVADPKTGNKNFAKFWYPTVLLNMDMKKALPEEGVDFLFVRTQAKRIRNGRLDLEVTIWDETGDVVVLSHHVCLVLSASRNTAQRRRDPPADTSKL